MRFRAILLHGSVLLLSASNLSTRVYAQTGRSTGTRMCASESNDRGQIVGPHLDRVVRGILTDSTFARSRAQLDLQSTATISKVADESLCARIVEALDAQERRGRANLGKSVWVRQMGRYLAVTDAVAVAGEWATLWIMDPDLRVRQRWTF